MAMLAKTDNNIDTFKIIKIVIQTLHIFIKHYIRYFTYFIKD